MGIHQNFIGGNWTEASTAGAERQSLKYRDIVGEYC